VIVKPGQCEDPVPLGSCSAKENKILGLFINNYTHERSCGLILNIIPAFPGGNEDNNKNLSHVSRPVKLALLYFFENRKAFSWTK
jgi:hypothetical protein